MKKTLLMAAAAACLLAVPAGAQTAAPPATGQAGATDLNFMTRPEAGVWRASDLIGKDVYNANNEDIGEVGDVLLDRNGQVRGVIVDVGGFLGIGESEVALPMRAFQFRDEPGAAGATGATAARTGVPAGGTAATGTTATGTATTGAAANRGAAAASGDGPDRIILIVTKDQLQKAPKYEDRPQAATGSGAATPRQ